MAVLVDDDARRAERLLAWLERWPHASVSLRDIQQRAPRPLRKLTTAKRVVSILERLGCLERVPDEATTDGRPPRDVWRIVRRGCAVVHYDKSAKFRWRLIWADQIASVERALAEAVSRIEAQRPTHSYGTSDHRWGLYRSDAAALVKDWGPRAARLGHGLTDLLGWDGGGVFPSSAMRSLAWRLAGLTITHLERDVAICGKAVFRLLPGDGGLATDVHLDRDRERATKWSVD
jgi:hypothetical protein